MNCDDIEDKISKARQFRRAHEHIRNEKVGKKKELREYKDNISYNKSLIKDYQLKK